MNIKACIITVVNVPLEPSTDPAIRAPLDPCVALMSRTIAFIGDHSGWFTIS